MTLRARQADAARALIREAAREAFFEHGYVGTTMTDIAQAAGVARQTLYNLFDSKAALLIEVIRHRVSGPEERSQQEDHARVLSANAPREMIELFAKAAAGVAIRSVPIYQIALEAAAIDGEVDKALTANEEDRFEAQRFFVRALHDKGFLRTDVPVADLERGFWMLSSPQMAVTATEAGWDAQTYARWLTDTVSGLLLPGG